VEGVITKYKYLKDKTLSQVQVKPIDSSFWKGIMGGRDEFFECGSFVLGGGRDTRFWEDVWLGDTPLSPQYPVLYNIVRHKQLRVADVLSNTPLNIGFRPCCGVTIGNHGYIWYTA
jgi:hypothetical protein